MMFFSFALVLGDSIYEKLKGHKLSLIVLQ